jgi:2-oxoglutarate dehydrogenase complex dehydrogenase (E1) component-like enzyme
MAISFPDSLDSLTNPLSTDSLANHAQQHSDVNDAIESIQTKIGIDGSEDTNSLDYKVATVQSQIENLGDSTTIVSTLLGLDGNNDLVVEGIENKTTIDSFSKTAYRSAEYSVQISKNSLHESFKISLLHDGTDIFVTTSNVISNTESSLATVGFEENTGIISLTVTPISGSVTARYYRTALKI